MKPSYFFHFSLLLLVVLLSSISATNLYGQVPPIIPPLIPVTDPAATDPKANPELNNNGKETIEEENKLKAKAEEDRKKRQEEEDVKDILALKRSSQLPEAKIWGQQFFRNQSISLFTRSRDIKAIDSYILGIGDELEITVWGAADFSKNVAINENGYVDLSIPELLIPRLYLKGMKFSNAKEAIVQHLNNHMYLRGSMHDIQLNYSRSITVNITGEVFHPGSYTIPAINTAFNALVASGGPSQIGSVRKIKVVSSIAPTRTLDIYKFANNPNISDEFFLTNNDYIFVPLAERVVEVKGMVKRPYYYELIDGEDLKTVLQYAGGLAADAYLRNIQIRRYSNDEERIIDLNLGDMLTTGADFKLLNGDIINISPIKEAYSNYVLIDGAVKLPGEYELTPSTRIREVLLKSGIMHSAVMEKIYVTRLRPDFSVEYINLNVDSVLAFETSADNILLKALDKIEVKFKSQFIDRYDIKLYGAVRQPGNYEYSDSLTLYDLIYLANGLKNEAANSYIEVSRLQHRTNGTTFTTIEQLSIDDSLNIANSKSYYLQPHDQVFVRLSKGFELPQNVNLAGEVMFPGIYTIQNKGERISDLIDRAGGYSSIAFLEGARLQRKGEGFVVLNLREVMSNKESRFNYILKPGDALVIPKIKDLVAIAGRVNHPEIKENSDIAEIELKLRLLKTNTEIEREEIKAEEEIGRKKNPAKINVPFHADKKANYYIKEYAGGIDKENGGLNRLIYVRYPSGAVKKTRSFLCFKNYPKVEPGAMVYVDTKTFNEKQKKRQRDPINWNKIISDSFAMLTSALTIVVLIRAINR